MKLSNIALSVFGMLLGFFMFCGIYTFFNLANAEVPQKDMGWHVTVKDANGKITAMAATGEQGGQLTFACDVKTHKLGMRYSLGGVLYDFVTVRRIGATDMTTMAGKMVLGSGMTTQHQAFLNVLDNDIAFVVARFPVGSQHAWEEAARLKLEEGPNIMQEGDEYFIAGKEDWKLWLQEISKSCPVDKRIID